MVECPFSDKEFDSKHEMYLYWAENHMDELNSHQKDKVKKAKRKEENKRQEELQWRKKMMMRGVAGLVVVFVVYLSAPAIANLFAGGGSIDFDDLELENQPMQGDEDAEVTVVEFGDYLCPACQQFEQQVKPDLMELIEDGDVNFYYLDIKLPQFNPDNTQASIAAQCVYEQDEEEFWDFHDALYVNQGQINYDASGLTGLAEDSTEDLDYEQLETCIEDEETSDAVDRDNRFADNNGVTATPTVFVNGDRVADWENLPQVIEDNYL